MSGLCSSHWVFALNRWLAPPMFLVTLVFSACMHDAIVASVRTRVAISPFSFWFMIGSYPLFLLEYAIYRLSGAASSHEYFKSALFPPCRIARSDLATQQYIWFPLCGWALTKKQLSEFVFHYFTFGMAACALIITGRAIWLFATGVSLTTLTGDPVFLWTMLFIWMAAVIECVILFATIGKKTIKEYRSSLAITLSPLLSIIALIMVRRLMRGIWTPQVHLFPQRRIKLLERKIAEHLSEMEFLREEISLERRRIEAFADSPADEEPSIEDVQTGAY